jgi:hypothetical protein
VSRQGDAAHDQVPPGGKHLPRAGSLS